MFQSFVGGGKCRFAQPTSICWSILYNPRSCMKDDIGKLFAMIVDIACRCDWLKQLLVMFGYAIRMKPWRHPDQDFDGNSPCPVPGAHAPWLGEPAFYLLHAMSPPRARSYKEEHDSALLPYPTPHYATIHYAPSLPHSIILIPSLFM